MTLIISTIDVLVVGILSDFIRYLAVEIMISS